MAKILIIDDDEDLQALYKEILEQHDFKVVSALGPDEGIDLVASEKPDLVVLDIMMPDGFEGFEVARAIREDLGLMELPIIVMSAVHEVKKIPYRFTPDEKHLPVDLWLDKPFSPEDLVTRIRTALNETPGQPG